MHHTHYLLHHQHLYPPLSSQFLSINYPHTQPSPKLPRPINFRPSPPTYSSTTYSLPTSLVILDLTHTQLRSRSMESEKKSSSISNFGAWGMNVVSSVGIIMANKQLMSNNGYAFTFAITLTGFHFVVTALVGIVSNATGYSASKHVPLWELIWLSVHKPTKTQLTLSPKLSKPFLSFILFFSQKTKTPFDPSMAEEAKAKGNAAFSSGDFSTAIRHFSATCYHAIIINVINHYLLLANLARVPPPLFLPATTSAIVHHPHH